MLIFRLQPAGFTNRDLRALTAQLRGLPPEAISTGQMTYDLRRLRLHGLIDRIPHSHRYRVSDAGLPTAIFLTRVHDRFLPTGLAHLSDPGDAGPLHAAATATSRPSTTSPATAEWRPEPTQHHRTRLRNPAPPDQAL